MKRKADDHPDDVLLKTKAPIVERIIFQKALLEILKRNGEHEHQYVDYPKWLNRSGVPDLRQICTEFNLQVSKSGRGKRPASVKHDFIHAIVRHLQSLSIPLVEDANIPNKTLSTIGNITLENSLSAHMDVEPEFSTIGNITPEISLSAKMDVEPELINDRSVEAPALSELGDVQVRTFGNRKDFLYQSSIKYPRRHGEGIDVQDLGKRLYPAGLYESDCLMKLVDPFNFKPVYIPDMYIDPVVIDMHIKRQGYLRLVLIQE
ncbi:hypothetical protein GALMADRAFT_142785 [Galerina marginata CBS 339.88]|uniref:Uncharacterized protein n=1 Tax=Galerina marginata (strain CBS 339.88) TaxID=685588 RepID=A0A067SSS8_GALM3|nr:hypothetical protein GALMADRAFT_142785 [Galerina marginata CBS 339.88]